MRTVRLKVLTKLAAKATVHMMRHKRYVVVISKKAFCNQHSRCISLFCIALLIFGRLTILKKEDGVESEPEMTPEEKAEAEAEAERYKNRDRAEKYKAQVSS